MTYKIPVKIPVDIKIAALLWSLNSAANRIGRWKLVISELNELAATESDPNLKACAEMSAGDLTEFLTPYERIMEAE